MKFSISTVMFGLAVVANAGPSVSYFSGFNLGHTHRTGTCKTTAAFQQEFNKMKSWSTGARAKFDYVKLFSTNDCNALENAVPAAINAGVKLWVGVWNHDDNKFNAEKAALERMLQRYPNTQQWLAGINVGSESLYRKDVTPEKLAAQIYDVKGMVQVAYKATHAPVGTADTWTMWVAPENKKVAEACDVALMNGFPYWQGATPQEGLAKMKQAIWDSRRAIGYEKPFVIGETGWPTRGGNFGAAYPNLENAQLYWKDVACWLQTRDYPWFWFSAFDEPNKNGEIEQSFGVATDRQPLKIALSC